MLTREPAVAGTFYPGDAEELRLTVSKMLERAESEHSPQLPVKAIIVPHAGYQFSGEVAAKAFAPLRPYREQIKTVVLLGPAHRVYFKGIAAPAAENFKTPVGLIPVDQEAIVSTKQQYSFVQVLPESHREEHSLEVQLPFLQDVLDDFIIIPLLVGDAQPGQVEGVIDFLWGDESTLIVISSDLSHFHDYSTAKIMDGRTASAIEHLQAQGLSGEYACGYLPLSGMLLAARRRHLYPERVGLCNSGDTAGDRSRVVGYGAWVFREKGSQ